MTLLTLLQTQAGGSNATASPGVGSLSLQGFAPTVVAQQNVTVAPAIDTLVLTGLAPTVSTTGSATASPGTGALVLQGYPPTVTVPVSVSVSPGAGALTITGYQPTISTAEPIEGPLADTHDGISRTNWKAREDRGQKSRDELREIIRAAVTQAIGGPAPMPSMPAPTIDPKPLSGAARKQIAQTLLKTVEVPDGMATVRALTDEIRRIEKQIADQIEIDREIDEEDELILMWAA
jgi:hypothetical protein